MDTEHEGQPSPMIQNEHEASLWCEVYVSTSDKALEARVPKAGSLEEVVSLRDAINLNACDYADRAVESFRARIQAGEREADKW